jgi:hypothetical protein
MGSRRETTPTQSYIRLSSMDERYLMTLRFSLRVFSPMGACSLSVPFPTSYLGGTMKKLMVILILLPILIVQAADAQPKANSKDTSPYNIVSEYIRSLSAVHRIQQTATNEAKEAGDDHMQSMMNAIRNFTRFKLELNASIGMLGSMRLTRKPFDDLIPATIFIYKEKVKLFDEDLQISKMFATPIPKPGVDYQKMATRMPEITAKIGYLDETLFQSMVIVCGLLIDEKPDSEGHMSHLNISTEQRQSMIDRIDSAFGESLNSKNTNYTVASAGMLKTFLQGSHKSTDEWQQK